MSRERRVVVVKIGGSVLERTPAGEAVLDAVAAAWRAGEPLVVVHGGGGELSHWLARLGIASRFVDGQRVTDAETIPVALMVLGGLVNRRLVEGLVRRGCPAVGLTGVDGAGTLALPVEDGLGAVGRITSVTPGFYAGLVAAGRVPVIASLAWNPEHGWLNVNADLMAAALAAALRARRLLLMTDVDGVLDESGRTIPLLTAPGVMSILDRGLARDGMIPKLRACHEALAARVPEILIGSSFPGTSYARAGTRIVAGGAR